MTDKEDAVNKEDQKPTAESKKTEKEHMIPKSRLDEVLKKNEDLNVRLDTLEKEGKQRLEAQLQEQGKYKELAEERAKELAEMQPKADQLEAAESALREVLTAQVELIPEDKRSLVPKDYAAKDQLSWIAENQAQLSKLKAPDLNTGKRGGGEDKTVVLTPDQKEYAKITGVSEEDYAKQLT